MDITQTFYDNLASQYDQLFADWHATTKEQALLLDRLFAAQGFDRSTRILDCACGIGTQAIGLAALGYHVTASDFSEGALTEAKKRAAQHQVPLRLEKADFCALSEVFSEAFNIVIAMDNALPHMLTAAALENAIRSITGQIAPGGIFVASIRDYDTLLRTTPPYSPPYIHETADGQRVAFQTWKWEGDCYQLIQYIIEDGQTLQVSKFACQYRATERAELTALLKAHGCAEVQWLMPEDSGFYQPIVIAKKQKPF